jgi:hypothetical protein
MRKGVLVGCVFHARLSDMESGVYIRSTAGTGGENPRFRIIGQKDSKFGGNAHTHRAGQVSERGREQTGLCFGMIDTKSESVTMSYSIRCYGSLSHSRLG